MYEFLALREPLGSTPVVVWFLVFFFSVFFSYFSGIRAAHLFSFCVVFSLCVLCAQCYKCLGCPFLILYFKIDIKSILFRSFLKLKTKTWIFIKLTCGSEKNKFQ
jgi:hypothetical protein